MFYGLPVDNYHQAGLRYIISSAYNSDFERALSKISEKFPDHSKEDILKDVNKQYEAILKDNDKPEPNKDELKPGNDELKPGKDELEPSNLEKKGSDGYFSTNEAKELREEIPGKKVSGWRQLLKRFIGLSR